METQLLLNLHRYKIFLLQEDSNFWGKFRRVVNLPLDNGNVGKTLLNLSIPRRRTLIARSVAVINTWMLMRYGRNL